MMILRIKNTVKRHLPSGSLRARFVFSTFWVMVSTVIQQGLGMVGTVVAARLLGKVVYGQLGMIHSTVGMFSIFAGLGLALTATKHVAEYRDTDKARAGRIITLAWMVALISGSIMTLAVLGGAGYLSAATLNAPEIKAELQIGSFMLFFGALIGAQRGVLAGLEAFRSVALTALIQGVFQLVFVVVGAVYWGLRGAIAGYAFSNGLGWLASSLFVRHEMSRAKLKLSVKGLSEDIPVLWKFSLPAFASTVLVGPVMWAARAILVNTPDGYAEMGVFSAATRFQQLIGLVGQTFGTALLPMLASKDGSKSELFQRSNILISWVAGLLPALLLITVPEIMGFIFGAEFTGSQANMALVLVMCFSCINLYKQGLARVLVARSMLWWGLLSNSTWAATLLFLAYLWRSHGAVGLASAFVAAYASNTAIFIPLYTMKKLVPKSTIFSWEALIIWFLLIIQVVLFMADVTVTVRIISLLVIVPVIFLIFSRILWGKQVAFSCQV